MPDQSNSPLDIDEVVSRRSEKPDSIRGSLLELLAIGLIVTGFILKNKDAEIASQFIIIGWSLSALLYLMFSWLMFRVKDYQKYEVILSVLCGLTFVIGILGMLFVVEYWEGGPELMTVGLYSGAVLFVITIILFIINIRQNRAAAFYRNLLARLLIFCVILIRLHPEMPC